MLENLPPETLPRLLRRTSVSALVVGVVAFVVVLFLGSPLGALGLAIGIAMAVVNFRFLDRQVAKVEMGDTSSAKAVRKRLRSRTFGRLGAVTIVVGLAVWLSVPLGMGIVSGLVMYQIVFVANMFRLVASQGGIQ